MGKWAQIPKLWWPNFFRRIYYKTFKDIYPGQELLIDYGKSYAKYLGIHEELQLSAVSIGANDIYTHRFL